MCVWLSMNECKGQIYFVLCVNELKYLSWGIVKGAAPPLVFICPLDTRFLLIFIIMDTNIKNQTDLTFRGDGNGHAFRNPDNYHSPNSSPYDATGIRATRAYKQAYDLFSKLDDNSWLQRLEAIADSVPYYSANNVFQELFNPGEIANKNKEAISIGVQQIQQLVAEYQEFVNSLPSTQAKQFSDANLNPLTQSFSGSNINPSITPQSAGTPEVTPVTDIISGLVGVVSSVSGGLLSFASSAFNVYKTLNDARISERNQLVDFASKGITSPDSLVSKKNRSFNSMLAVDKLTAKNAVKNETDYLKANLENRFESDFFGRFFNDYELNDVFKDISDLNFQIYQVERSSQLQSLKSKNSQDVYNQEYFDNVDASLAADSYDSQNDINIKKNDFENSYYSNQKTIENSFNSLIRKWHQKANEGSVFHQYLLLNLRTSGNTGVGDVVGAVKDLVK